MEPGDLQVSACPLCGARIGKEDLICPRCRGGLGGLRFRPRVPWRYDLASIMIFILVFAVGLGLSLRLATAGIGVPILLLGPATVVRAAPIFVDRRREGRNPRTFGPFAVVLESITIVGLLLLAGSIAFVSVCFPIGLMTIPLYGDAPYFWVPFTAGGLAACLMLYRIGRRTFPPRD